MQGILVRDPILKFGFLLNANYINIFAWVSSSCETNILGVYKSGCTDCVYSGELPPMVSEFKHDITTSEKLSPARSKFESDTTSLVGWCMLRLWPQIPKH